MVCGGNDERLVKAVQLGDPCSITSMPACEAVRLTDEGRFFFASLRVRGIGEEVCGLGFGVEMPVGSYRVRAVSLIVFLLHTNLYLHLAQTNRRRFTVTVSRMLG